MSELGSNIAIGFTKTSKGGREEQKTTATATAVEIARTLDRRLYRQRRFLWALRSGEPHAIEEARQQYVESLFEWNDNFGRFKASLWASFDRLALLDFENELHAKFAQIGSALEGIYRDDPPNKIRVLAVCERALDELGRKNHEFVYGRLSDVRDEVIGDLPAFSFVSHRNWRRMSAIFLLRRLFGLTQQS